MPDNDTKRWNQATALIRDCARKMPDLPPPTRQAFPAPAPRPAPPSGEHAKVVFTPRMNELLEKIVTPPSGEQRAREWLRKYWAETRNGTDIDYTCLDQGVICELLSAHAAPLAAEIERLKEIIECSKTPMMADVLADLARLRQERDVEAEFRRKERDRAEVAESALRTEREACAQIVDRYASQSRASRDKAQNLGWEQTAIRHEDTARELDDIAAAIRARKD